MAGSRRWKQAVVRSFGRAARNPDWARSTEQRASKLPRVSQRRTERKRVARPRDAVRVNRGRGEHASTEAGRLQSEQGRAGGHAPGGGPPGSGGGGPPGSPGVKPVKPKPALRGGGVSEQLWATNTRAPAAGAGGNTSGWEADRACEEAPTWRRHGRLERKRCATTHARTTVRAEAPR